MTTLWMVVGIVGTLACTLALLGTLIDWYAKGWKLRLSSLIALTGFVVAGSGFGYLTFVENRVQGHQRDLRCQQATSGRPFHVVVPPRGNDRCLAQNSQGDWVEVLDW